MLRCTAWCLQHVRCIFEHLSICTRLRFACFMLTICTRWIYNCSVPARCGVHDASVRMALMMHKNLDVSIIFDSILFISIAIVYISFVSMCVAAASERSFNRHRVKYWLMAHPLAHTAAITTPAAIPTVAASRLKRGCGLRCCFARM